MELKKNVVAAISAAVNAYIEEDEMAFAATQQRAAAPPQPTFSPWVMAGRAAAMAMRTQWQLRLVRNC